jgi:hypothetical protein
LARRISLNSERRERLPSIRSSFNVAAAIVERLMKSAIENSLPDEHYVIRIDGRVRSHHRRFVDALREGLRLKDQFPQHDVKVQALQASRVHEAALH